MRGHLRKTAGGAWAPWSLRANVLLLVLICHAALFYVIWKSHAPAVRGSSGGISETFTGQTLFAAAVSNEPGARAQGILARPWPQTSTEAEWIVPPRRWKFPVIDLWPSPAGWCPNLTEFNIEAQPDTPDVPMIPRDPRRSRGPRPKLSVLRLIRWLRPVYPIDAAATNMEGSASLDMRIDPRGRPLEVRIARSSGAPARDAAAASAARFWRFAPPLARSHPGDLTARFELKFHFFTFELSRLGEHLTGAPSVSTRFGRRAERVRDHEPLVRGLVEDLRSGTPEQSLEAEPAAERQALSAAVQRWGPVTQVAYAGFDGNPEWRTYATKREPPRVRRDQSVAVRWETYRVSHEANTSLWKIAFDRKGRLWAMKADLVPRTANAGSTSACGETH